VPYSSAQVAIGRFHALSFFATEGGRQFRTCNLCKRRQQRQDLGASVLPTIPSGSSTTTTQAAGERNITHGVLSERYHLGGRVETDTVAMAAARQEQAASAGQQLVFLVEREKLLKSLRCR